MLNIYISMLDDAESKHKFEQIYVKYKYLMLYVANQRISNSQWAEDIVHDSFLKIIKNFDRLRLDNDKEISALVVTITKNCVYNFNEKNKRNVIIDEDDVLDNYTSNRHCNFAEDCVIDTIYTSEAIAVMKSLDDKYSLPMSYAALGYKLDDIAAIMELSQTAVKGRIFRGRQKLYEEVGVTNE